MGITTGNGNNNENNIKERYNFPCEGFEDSTQSGDSLALGILGIIVRIIPRLATSLGEVLEYDENSYAVEVTGTPEGFTQLGCTDIGFTLTLRVYPRLYTVRSTVATGPTGHVGGKH